MEHDGRPVVVSVDQVDLVRGGRYLLSGVSVDILAGEHWAVLGPNGAGKSTLLSLLGAVAHPTRGSVHVLGHQLGRVDMRHLRASIGHVDPRYRLDQPLPALDVVLTGLTNTALPVGRRTPNPLEYQRAEHLLDVMGMLNRTQAPWTNMSQGERGRVLIARALMSNPSLLLLDEPATGLDLAAREQLLIAIAQLRTTVPNLATVMVTHHLEELPIVTSHALLLRDGAVRAVGPVDIALTSDTVSECFGFDVAVARHDGRWGVRAGQSRADDSLPHDVPVSAGH